MEFDKCSGKLSQSICSIMRFNEPHITGDETDETDDTDDTDDIDDSDDTEDTFLLLFRYISATFPLVFC